MIAENPYAGVHDLSHVDSKVPLLNPLSSDTIERIVEPVIISKIDTTDEAKNLIFNVLKPNQYDKKYESVLRKASHVIHELEKQVFTDEWQKITVGIRRDEKRVKIIFNGAQKQYFLIPKEKDSTKENKVGGNKAGKKAIHVVKDTKAWVSNDAWYLRPIKDTSSASKESFMKARKLKRAFKKLSQVLLSPVQ